MVKSAQTHVTPDLPPAVEVPDLRGARVTPGGERGDGDRRDRKQTGKSAAADGRAGKARR